MSVQQIDNVYKSDTFKSNWYLSFCSANICMHWKESDFTQRLNQSRHLFEKLRLIKDCKKMYDVM